MKLRLVEADDDTPETEETPTVENPPKEETPTTNNDGGKTPSWNSLKSTREKAEKFEEYFNERIPPFKVVDKEKGNFDRGNRDDINTYITNVFDKKNIGRNLGKLITKSIQEQGIKPADNDFISFLIEISDNNNISASNITEEKAELIRQYLKNGVLDIDDTKWLFDSKAYNGGKYKVQALILLSNEDEIKKYMDPKEATKEGGVIDQVLGLTNDEEIKKLLVNSQTRQGEDRYVYGKGGKSGNDTTSIERLTKLINAMVNNEAKATKYAKQVFNPKENESSLLHKAALAMAKDSSVNLEGEETSQQTTDTNQQQQGQTQQSAK